MGEIHPMLNLNNKAGMDDIDKARINDIIYEASKGSKFYENELRREKQLRKQVDALQNIRKDLSIEDIEKGEMEADKLIKTMIDDRNFIRLFVHIDMDAFYAAVEIRDDPSLRTKPMAVGSMSMLSTSNYVARRFGVRAAMPGFIAKKLCTDLILIEPDFQKYTRLSHEVRKIFAEYDQNFTSMSLDEAYLDFTEHMKKRYFFSEEQMIFKAEKNCRCKSPITNEKPHKRLFHVCQLCGKLIGEKRRTFENSIWSAVEELRFRIFCETQLTCSAGIAANTLLAKIASDINKPNGQYHVSFTDEDIEDFMRNLPVRKVPGIGKVSERKLSELGINTCGDLLKSRGVLFHLFRPISFNYFMRIAIGEGSQELNDIHSDVLNDDSNTPQKSMSLERTFSDCKDPAILIDKCKYLCKKLCEDLAESRMKAKCVSIKLKLSSFELRTRAQTMVEYSSDVNLITNCAVELLSTEINNSGLSGLCLRLLGVRVSTLIGEEFVAKSNTWSLLKAFKSELIDREIDDVKTIEKTEKCLKCHICSQIFEDTEVVEHSNLCCRNCVQSTSNTTLNSSSSNLKRKAPSLNSKISKDFKGPLDKYFVSKDPR